MNEKIIKTSNELELGKAGEYYAIFKIMKQGFVAYPSDQGLPYDVVVDIGGRLLRGQIKSTRGISDYGKMKSVYRWGTRSAKKTVRATRASSTDFYAFVAIDDELVAFMATSEIISKKNPESVNQCVEMRNKNIVIPGRSYPNGTIRKACFGRYVEDYQSFERVERIINAKV
ncbi:group I intron-associated PD-(D/E)XK endonuclease [Pectobacterium carotovorum]|uniref:group I intron-associated PD-(D/E)XK endonuclease n=1 Tax=Pectobacterium carotovorum TaxID=554 RepID=UPI000D7372B6|nr:group I intron-associated PD-(D/E)XK endonuclease [Pectobacterium carotovorum]PXB01145.1 hypothetical protein DMB41_16240 [Pectobacterium carotovorum subsp. carotovorum]